MMLTGLGMGLTFGPLSVVALAKVPNKDTGVASSLLNTGQQVGGSIGLAILGTVAWSAVASNTKSAIAATGGAHLTQTAQTALANHALAFGFGRGYLVSALISFLATDGVKPEWLATYEIKPGTLETPAYKALWENASEREKRIMSSVGTLDRRVYAPLSDSWADGVSPASGAPPVVLAVSMSVPP